MPHRTLNLGILAHVDAGKTTLTERLLLAAGVIEEIGSVDEGTTQTDSLPLERLRGITIKTAVVSFTVGDLTVNLIDTPGHPDFIAEVERALGILDAAVLVVSAVEGVQPQTRILMRALQRLGVPTLIFVNKIDRAGASPERVLAAMAGRLSPDLVPMGTTEAAGTKAARFVAHDTAGAGFAEAATDVLARHDEGLVGDFVDNGGRLPSGRIMASLRQQVATALVHPVFFGSALTGAGQEELAAGIAQLLPASNGAADGPVSATVYKIERGRAGDKLVYVRMRTGTLQVRDRVRVGRRRPRTVTSVAVCRRGVSFEPGAASAGDIARLAGLAEVRIGDTIGAAVGVGSDGGARDAVDEHNFAPPTFEAVVHSPEPGRRSELRAALGLLAEQDPLIGLRQDDAGGEIHVSLYGEIQKEIIAATLAADFGLEVEFEQTTTLCVERPIGSGAAVEHITDRHNPFLATVGLCVEPAAEGTGVVFRRATEVLGTMPIAFFRAVEDTVGRTLRQGLYGWQVVDVAVTMTHSGYYPRQSHSHQGFSKAMSSTGEDFRGLTPLVLMAALHTARTRVCEPVHRFRLEAPADCAGPLLPLLARLRAVPEPPVLHGGSCTLEGDVPAARVDEIRRQLPGLTRGEGLLETTFDHHAPVAGPPPSRRRTDDNPLDRKEYLLRLTRRAARPY